MAGNARFHDKLHRKNHHTNPTVGFADSANDPIASPSEPFQGDFVVNGQLSSNKGISLLSASVDGDIYCNNIYISSVTYTNYISGNSTQVIISDKESLGFGNNTLNLDFKTAIYNRVNNNTVMYIAPNNIGIMTESPRSTVDILGNAFIQATTAVTVETGLLTLIKPSSAYNTNDLEIRTYGSWANGINSTAGGLKIKSAGGTFTTPTQTLSGRFGYIIGSSTHDGNTWKNSVAINFGLEENALIDNQPSFISFDTLSGGITGAKREVMRITSDGNVGIGTTSPLEKLHVVGNLLVTGNISAFGDTTQIDTVIVSTSGMIIDTLGTTDALRVTQRGTGNAILVEDDTNPDSSAFVVNSSGNVGIGTITPRSKLDMGANVIAGVANIRGHSNSGAYSIWGGLGSDASVDGGYIQLYGSAHSTNPHLLVLGNSNAGTRVAITSGGNVGIGTLYPNGTLDVTANTTGAALFISQQNIDGYAILIQDNGGPDRPFVVKNRGFVGIGTLSPNKELTVVGDISANGLIYSKDIYLNRGDTQREGGQINFGRSYDNTTAFAIDTYTDNIGSLSSRLRFIDVPSSAERMTMLSSGNVGIGVANPISKLHIDGDITVSNGRYLNLDTNNGGGNTAIRRNTGENGMEFFTQSASRMFIADDGKVGIGTKIPNKELTVVGDISATGTIYTASSSYSLSSNGYTKLPNGLIMQWGNFRTGMGSSSQNADVIFPVSYTTACYSFVASIGVGASNYDTLLQYRQDKQSISYGIPNLSGVKGQAFIDTNNQDDRIVQWNAIGY